MRSGSVFIVVGYGICLIGLEVGIASDVMGEITATTEVATSIYGGQKASICWFVVPRKPTSDHATMCR
jgi:hypothetical protein